MYIYTYILQVTDRHNFHYNGPKLKSLQTLSSKNKNMLTPQKIIFFHEFISYTYIFFPFQTPIWPVRPDYVVFHK